VERDDVISLQDYLVVLKRQRWIVAATVILVVVAAVGVSLAQTPVYEAESEVIVEPVRRTQDVSLEDLWYQASAVQTEQRVITSRAVAERAAAQLDMDDHREALAGLRVQTVPDTRVVRIIVSSTDPAAAAARANAFATAYLEHRRAEAVEGIVAARTDLEGRAASLRQEIAEMESAAEVDEVQRDALLAQLAAVVSQAAEVGGSADAVAGGGSILAPAEVPTAPVAPRPVRTGALALVLGLLLGVGLAFLRDHIDDVVRDESDFKRATGGRPILGRIPHWVDPEGGERLATLLEPSSIASESYRELSAGVRFLLLAHADSKGEAEASPDAGGTRLARSIMVASAHAGDGKTSTAANLAVAAARVGLRTLLIDADLRRASVHKRFGFGQATGLTDVLLSGDDLRDHVLSVGVDNLRVLPAGTIPPNPHELLASPAMRALERDVLRRADLVIYDSPAVLAVPDALELGRHVDVTILVGRAGSSSRRQLSAAIERMEQVGTDVAGTVLNDIDSKNDGYYYSYYYADAPAADEAQTNGRGERRPGAIIRRGRSQDDDTVTEPNGYPAAGAPAHDHVADEPVGEPLDEPPLDEPTDEPQDEMTYADASEETLFGDR
jgi:polysaccharide biosynthesis transport protein